MGVIDGKPVLETIVQVHVIPRVPEEDAASRRVHFFDDRILRCLSRAVWIVVRVGIGAEVMSGGLVGHEDVVAVLSDRKVVTASHRERRSSRDPFHFFQILVKDGDLVGDPVRVWIPSVGVGLEMGRTPVEALLPARHAVGIDNRQIGGVSLASGSNLCIDRDQLG